MRSRGDPSSMGFPACLCIQADGRSEDLSGRRTDDFADQFTAHRRRPRLAGSVILVNDN